MIKVSSGASRPIKRRHLELLRAFLNKHRDNGYRIEFNFRILLARLVHLLLLISYRLFYVQFGQLYPARRSPLLPYLDHFGATPIFKSILLLRLVQAIGVQVADRAGLAF